VLIPGPAFLQLLGIGAGQGRKAGAFFMMGHLVGDILWSTLALVAIVGAKTIGSFVFDLLGLLCGFYLAWIGWSAVNAKPKAVGQAVLVAGRPSGRGLIFGAPNPKGYPVALAPFPPLVGGSASALDSQALPMLLSVSFVGFVTADIILIGIIGAGIV